MSKSGIFASQSSLTRMIGDSGFILYSCRSGVVVANLGRPRKSGFRCTTAISMSMVRNPFGRDDTTIPLFTADSAM